MSAALATLTERVYVSQFTTAVFGVTVRKAGEPADADGNVVVRLIEEASGNTIATLTATHVQTGDYQITLISSHTAQTGLYTLRWEYAIDGTPEEFESYIEVGPSNPAYDDLDEDFKDLVDTVWLKFADSYDSPGGGPHAQVHLQSHFSRGRFAQLLRTAVGRLGVIQPPKTVYTLSADEGKKFPLATWGWVLEQALFVEVLKHLIRTYTEQPEVVGVNVARTDRRDYVRRWETVLTMEQRELDSALDLFKVQHMGLGSASIMVSGGVYGRYAPTRVAHSAAARPRYYARFYA